MSLATKNTALSPQNRQHSSQQFLGTRVQPKLAIGQPGDQYEVEADRTADSVVSKLKGAPEKQGAQPFLAPKPVVQPRKQDAMQQETAKKDEGDQEIQEKPISESITPLVQMRLPGGLGGDAPEETVKPVQAKCADCEAKEKKEEGSGEQGAPPVQMKCDKCAEKEQAIQRKGGTVELPEVPKAVGEKEEADPAKEQASGEGTAKTPEEGAKKGGEKAEGGEKGGVDMPTLEGEKAEVDEPKMEPVQAKSDKSTSGTGGIEQSLSASKGKGSAMSSDTQSQMNEGFGSDFSNVRIHTDANAVQMNKELGSHAFTNGSDIYFNEGKYDPGSDSGKHLLAHELTHTVQQGAASQTVQRYVGPAKTVTPEPSPEKPNDGDVMKGKADSKYENDENVQNQDDLDEDEAKEKKDPPRSEIRAENSEVKAEGVTQPPVDRGGQAKAKISTQKKQMNKELSKAPPKGDGKAAQKGGKKKAPLTAAQGKAKAAQAEAAAKAITVPATPQPFKHPNVVAPVDSAGQALPRKAEIDTQVRGLGYIGEMLRIKGYELKEASAKKTAHAHGLDAVIGKQMADLANARKGTQKIDDHNTERKEISETSKKVHEDSKQRQAFVAKEAPGLAGEAEGGKADSGGLASESASKARQAKSETPDDPDAQADAAKQNADMDQTADGAKSMDDAVNQTGERAKQYIAEAETAAKDNQQSEAKIKETDGVIAQLDTRVAEMKAKNEESNVKIQAVEAGPETMRQEAVRTAKTGDELISATMYMETELNALQDEYLAGMQSIEPYETAMERVKKEEAERKENPAGLSGDEQQLFELAAMTDEQQQATVDGMPEEKRQGLMAALEKMIAQTPDKGTDETEGARKEVNLGQLKEQGPPDPRQEQIDAVDNQRVSRLGGVLDVADVNMSYLTEEQQMMLAERLVGESLTDDVKNINVLQMAEGMIEGMLDPRVGLQGAIDGFGKTLTGVVNLFNAEAWAKDPLGNLLQVGADISTGLAQIFSSVLGIAGMITALMVAIIIISWGFATPVCAPVIGWMGTVMTYAGWGAIIAGSLSVLFNSLAYIKNLNDAGTAKTARELFGNTEQMKQNATDGLTGAMSIVEGVGAVKMGPVMKSGNFIKNIPTSPGAFFKNTLDGAKGGLTAVKNIPANIVKGAKKLFASGKKGLLELKDKIKGFFKRSNKADGPVDFDTPKKVPHDPHTNLGQVGGKKVEAEFDVGGGHKKKVLEDGKCATCSYCKEVQSNYKTELDDPKNSHLKKELDDIETKLASDPDNAELVKRHNDIESDLEIQRQKGVAEHNQQMIKKEKEMHPEKSNSEIAKSKSSEIRTNHAPEGMTPAQFREAQDFLKDKLKDMPDAKVVSTGSRQTGITTNPGKENFGNPSLKPKRDLDMRILTDKPMSSGQLKKLAAEFEEKFGIKLGIKQTPFEQWPHIPKFGVVEVL